MAHSPYLTDSHRLADVIAAIQAMGTYKFYKLDFAEWADRIVGDKTQEKYWRAVVEQHPEFFRLDSKRQKASLVSRRQRQKLFNVDTNHEISREEFRRLSDSEKMRISRSPLSSTEIEALFDVAIKLHVSQLEHQKDRRWWILAGLPFLGAITGALLGPVLVHTLTKVASQNSSAASAAVAASSPSPAPP